MPQARPIINNVFLQLLRTFLQTAPISGHNIVQRQPSSSLPHWISVNSVIMDHIDHVVVRANVITGNVVTKSEKSRNKYLEIGNKRNISKHTKFAKCHRFFREPSFQLLYSVALKSLIRQNFAHGTERQHCPKIPTHLPFLLFFKFQKLIHFNNEIWQKSINDMYSSESASLKKDVLRIFKGGFTQPV